MSSAKQNKVSARELTAYKSAQDEARRYAEDLDRYVARAKIEGRFTLPAGAKVQIAGRDHVIEAPVSVRSIFPAAQLDGEVVPGSAEERLWPKALEIEFLPRITGGRPVEVACDLDAMRKAFVAATARAGLPPEGAGAKVLPKDDVANFDPALDRDTVPVGQNEAGLEAEQTSSGTAAADAPPESAGAL